MAATTTMSDRTVYLGMPGYGKQTAQAGRGFWRACRDMTGVTNDYRSGSLLASNFNQLWCGALNVVHAGGTVDYFAMLHDDVGPDDYWVDTLIEELESRDLDVLGVVVPIKDVRGLTSLALHRDGDDWMPLARLSMHDVYQLPETFTSEDLGGRKLLLNTGCWVCRFDTQWAKKVHFEVNDRIVFNREANRYQAQTEPEDWYFSRLCHELGLRVGATRKVSVVHQGDMMFSNAKQWGQDKYDHESTDKSPVPGAFPYDISGWLLPEEGKALAELSRGKNVLEIGSFRGLSSVCIARTARHLTCVDYWDGRATGSPGDTYSEFQANIARHGVADKIVTRQPGEMLPLEEYDLVFIDGAHDQESVEADIQLAESRLAAGGLIVCHDYRPMPEGTLLLDPGVYLAVSEYVARGAEIIDTIGSLAVLRPAQTLMEVCSG